MSDFEGDRDEPRLTVVCTDGTTIGCTNFKAIDGGVLLTEDVKRKRVFGFVPHDQVRFVLPTETARRVVDEETTAERDEYDDPLMRLPGLGETYAKRLRSAGYASVGDLAGADPETLADQTGANETRTARWVERAESEVGDRATEEERRTRDGDERTESGEE